MNKHYFAGLADVEGGRLWFVSTPATGREIFYTKAEARMFIKNFFVGFERELLLKQLAKEKHRAWLNIK